MTYPELVNKVNFVNCIAKSVELATTHKTSAFIHFAPDVLTIETAELLTSYLSYVTTVNYDFDARNSLLTLRALDIQEDAEEIHCNVYVQSEAEQKKAALHYADATNNGFLN